jgi:hypothetical protein
MYLMSSCSVYQAIYLSGNMPKYTFEIHEKFKYLGVILNEDNNHQIDL